LAGQKIPKLFQNPNVHYRIQKNTPHTSVLTQTYAGKIVKLCLLKFNVFHVRALYYTKNINHQQMHKEFFSSIVNTHSYMFRPCWVIFREKLSVVVTLGCTIQLSENVLLTVHCHMLNARLPNYRKYKPFTYLAL
jgi:hypothetical protein